MKSFFFIPAGLQEPELEIMTSLAQGSIDRGDEVIIAVCSGGKNYSCSFNVWGLPPICYACKQKTKNALGLLSGEFICIDTPQIAVCSDVPNISDRYKLKAIELDGVDIGQAVYSSYLGSTRDLNLDGAVSQIALSRLYATASTLLKWIEYVIFEYRPDEILLYNGRQSQYRPVFRMGRKHNVRTIVVEYSGQSNDGVFRFENKLPQDLNSLEAKINKTYSAYSEDASKVAADYYVFKRSGGVINDSKSYVLDQKPGLLPADWGSDVKNLVIFNSSEDEFAALGGVYDDTLFPSQLEAIEFVVRSASHIDGLRVWLRVHPNLANVKWDFVAQLSELARRFKNFSVIPGNSSVSSYSVLDSATAVISFGSTIGIEAAYWGKPSILLGRCIYERLGSVYVPGTKDELERLIKGCSSLASLPILGSQKVAVFWSKGGEAIENFDGSRASGYSINGRRVQTGKITKLLYVISKAFEKYVIEYAINLVCRNIVRRRR